MNGSIRWNLVVESGLEPVGRQKNFTVKELPPCSHAWKEREEEPRGRLGLYKDDFQITLLHTAFSVLAGWAGLAGFQRPGQLDVM